MVGDQSGSGDAFSGPRDALPNNTLEAATDLAPPSTALDDPGVQPLQLIAGDTPQGYTANEEGMVHHHSTGGDVMPRSPLDNDIATIVMAMGSLLMFSGMGMMGLGVVINGILAYKSSAGGPHLWWAGVPTFLIGMGVTYAGVRRSRAKAYLWSTILIVELFAQVALMGIVGNFTTSNYDVYPLDGFNHGEPICGVFWHSCYCQDYYHGVYSEYKIPGVHYIYEGSVKWRETRFRSCHDVHLISRLYYSFMGCLGVYILAALLAFVLSYYGSICGNHVVKFNRLVESGGPVMPNTEQNNLPSGSKPYRDDPEQALGHDDEEENQGSKVKGGALVFTDAP